MTTTHTRRPRRTQRPILVGALIATVALVVSATGAVASHNFSDVSNAHPFHDEISAIADAGITTGFPDGTFRPTEPVTRQAMAAFMTRGLGRLRTTYGSEDLPGSGTKVVASDTLHSGATGSGAGQGVALIIVDLLATEPGSCPCEVEMTSRRNGSDWTDYVWKVDLWDRDQIVMMVPLEMDADTSTTVDVVGTRTSGTGRVHADAQILMMYAPFAGDA